MAKGFGKFWKKYGTTGAATDAKTPGERVNAHPRKFQEVFDLAGADVAKNIGDTNVVAVLPVGHVFDRVCVVSSVSLTTTQLSFGTAADPVKYGAAKAYGAVADVAVEWTKAAAMAADMSVGGEEVIMTIATAALPGAGTVVVEYWTSARN